MLRELLVGHLLELAAGDDALPLEQADLVADRRRGERVIAGDHRDMDTGAVTRLDRRGHLGPRRVDHAEDAHVDEVALEPLSTGSSASTSRIAKPRVR